ncbi:MAG TPA: Gfo/Idh/MocA family oxidoreductase [Acidimicrobiales bacterium]
MTLRIGVLAASRIAQPALIDPAGLVDGVELTAVAARDLERARDAAERWGLAHAYGSYGELIASPEVDAVYIGTPAALHREWAIAAIAAGKHVLCEKPFAANAADAQEIADAAAASDRVVMEAYHWRYHPFAGMIRAALDSGVLGPLQRAEARFNIPTGRISRSDIRWNLSLGGGGLMDLGCYSVQWVRFALGTDVVVVEATADCPVPDVDGTMRAELRWASGTTGSIESSMEADGTAVVADLVVHGERGTLTANNPLAPQSGASLVVETADGRSETTPDASATYFHQLVAFRDAVEHGAPFPTTAADGVATMQVIDDCYRAAGLPVRPRHA